MYSLVLYPIYAGDEIAPYYSMQKGFESWFSPCDTYDWVKKRGELGLEKMKKDFIEFVKQKRPDYCFMQIQSPEQMDPGTIRELSKYTRVLNWSGDVRHSDDWYKWLIAIGKECYMSLFTNYQDVEMLRKNGCNSAYFQIGYDDKIYYPQAGCSERNGIVFCANHYGHFPLSKFRVECAKALMDNFGDLFTLRGTGWKWKDIKPCTWHEEAELYRNAKIGISISHYDLPRYFSDRLLRIMACGAQPVSHYFQQSDIEVGGKCHFAHSVNDMVTKCKQVMRGDYYCENPEKLVQENYTWSARAKELVKLLMLSECN